MRMSNVIAYMHYIMSSDPPGSYMHAYNYTLARIFIIYNIIKLKLCVQHMYRTSRRMYVHITGNGLQIK